MSQLASSAPRSSPWITTVIIRFAVATVFACLCGLGAALAMRLLVAYDQSLATNFQAFVRDLTTNIFGAGYLVDRAFGRELDLPWLVAITSWGVVFLLCGAFSRRLYFNLFSAYDKATLSPVLPPFAFDPLRPVAEQFDDSGNARPSAPPLTWHEPKEGVRLEAWAALTRFALDEDSGVFSYQLLVGGAGAGKTRMAMEFARRILAKTTADGKETTEGGQSWKMRLSSWWRIRALGRSPRSEDIWDVGWLRPQFRHNNTRSTTRDASQLLQSLARWRPRRPSFVLIDDPHPGFVRQVILECRSQSAHYRHPVRLLVVNQTTPSETLDQAANPADGPISDIGPSFGDPITLPAAGMLSDTDLRHFVNGNGLTSKQAQVIVQNDASVEQFGVITRRNPLLVELAIDWLRRGKPYLDMSEDALLEERADRIIAAIKSAGLDERSKLVLATATICGGAPKYLSRSEGDLVPRSIWAHFGLSDLDDGAVARLFPAQEGDHANVIPPIRPAMIGRAFIRRVLASEAPEMREGILRLAWLSNPAGTLRSYLQIDAAYRGGGHEDVLKSTFDAVPIEGVGLSDYTLFEEFCRAAATSQIPDWNEGSPLIGAGLEDRAEELLHSLSPTETQAAFEFALSLLGNDRSTFYIREMVLNRLLFAIVQQLDAHGLLYTADVLNGLTVWCKSPHHATNIKAGILAWTPQAASPLGNDAEAALKALAHEAFCTLYADHIALVFFAVIKGAGGAPGSWAALAGHIAFWRQFLWSEQDDSTRQDHLAPIAAELIEAPGEFSRWPELYAMAANNMSYGYGIRNEEERGHRLKLRDTVAKLHAQQPNCPLIARAHAQCLCYYVLQKSSVEEKIARAKRLDAAFETLPDEENIEKERALAWYSLTHAHTNNGAQCIRYARIVDKIAAPFPDSESIQEQRANAWRSVTFAHRSNGSESIRYARIVDQIAEPFPENQSIQAARATAWNSAAFAHRNDGPDCIRHARIVDQIAKPFPESEIIQEQRATAWRSVAHAHTNNVPQCIRYARVVDKIAESFPNSESIQEQRANAWRGVTYAHSSNGPEYIRYARIVDQIAEPFPENESIQTERALAWCIAAFAHRNDGPDCIRYARIVDQIAEPFPENESIQQQRAVAWTCVCEAHLNSPACRTYALRVEEIARPFSKITAIQRLRSDAWRAVVFTLRTDPEGSLEALQVIETIALHFPDETEIQEHLRKARSYLPQN